MFDLQIDQWLPLKDVLAALPAMRHFDAAIVARGDQRSSQTGGGFTPNYRKAQTAAKMAIRPATSGQTWGLRRANFVKRHMAQVRKRGEPLFVGGIPTKRMLGFIAWAYVPPEASAEYRAWVMGGRPVTKREATPKGSALASNPTVRVTSAWDDPNRGPSSVQSILFDNKLWTVRAAKKWLKDHGFSAPVADRQRNVHRFRQRPPAEFASDSFRTIPFGRGTGISAVVAIRG